MALMTCSECEKEISDTAKACPHCGFTIKKANRTPLYIVGGLLSFLLIIFLLTREYKPLNMDREVYNLGVSALQTVDDYLDGKISSKDARDRLDNICNRLDMIEGTDSLFIGLDIYNIGVDILLSNRVDEKRNELAEELNKRKR